MRILHTSDWHLGKTLYGRKRHDEFSAFLNWLAETLDELRIDVLLVAGDVFDTASPSIASQEMYYRFLSRVAGTHCRHTVVTSGNHDSPGLLEAAEPLLSAHNVRISAHAKENPAEETFLLEDAAGKPELIVCAVPFLREKDLRSSESGENQTDKHLKVIQGIRKHYAQAGKAAEELSKAHPNVPVVGMGHLFAEGANFTEGDGTREPYVGTLARAGADVFPECFDYLALGHIHTAQKIGGEERFRYCGSPLQLGFPEAGKNKTQTLVEFDGRAPTCSKIAVPSFRRLENVRGDWGEIASKLKSLKSENQKIWLEVEYVSQELPGDLKGKIEEITEGSLLETLKIQNTALYQKNLVWNENQPDLKEAGPEEIFQNKLNAAEVPEEQRKEILPLFLEILHQTQCNETEN